jgi:teichuronic acid biosynthesis glycosyltransferase TuaC
MKVFYITNMYPTDDFIYNGIHVKEQIDYLVAEYNIDYEIYFINGRKSKFNYIKSIFLINSLIKKEHFDLIHIHFGLSGLFLLFNPFIKIPVVLTLHGSDISPVTASALMKKITTLVVSRSNKVIILNDKTKEVLKKFEDRLLKIPCGINVKDFNSNRKNLINKSFTIGFPGDIKRIVKNYKLFNEIMEFLRLEFDTRIVVFHNMTRPQLSEQLSKLDCLVMTSLSEGSPQMIKEALASNVPIISSKVGDVAELLAGVKNAYVIDSFDKEDYVLKIRKIISLPPKERRTNGIEKIKELELDQNSTVLKIFEVYKNLLKNQ